MDALLSMPWLYAELAADDSNTRDVNGSSSGDDTRREVMQTGGC